MGCSLFLSRITGHRRHEQTPPARVHTSTRSSPRMCWPMKSRKLRTAGACPRLDGKTACTLPGLEGPAGQDGHQQTGLQFVSCMPKVWRWATTPKTPSRCGWRRDQCASHSACQPARRRAGRPRGLNRLNRLNSQLIHRKSRSARTAEAPFKPFFSRLCADKFWRCRTTSFFRQFGACARVPDPHDRQSQRTMDIISVRLPRSL